MQRISVTPQFTPSVNYSFTPTPQFTPSFTSNPNVSFKAPRQKRNQDPQAGMPRSKDSYESSYKVEQDKKKEKRQKAGVYALVGMATMMTLFVALTLLTHKNQNQKLRMEAKYYEAEAKKASNEGGKDILGNIYEDLTKDLAIKDMSLHKSLEGTTKDLITQMSKPEEIAARGGRGTHSILLYGPPGTGKTTYAKAIAKEIPNAKFVALDVTKMKDKYVGETEKNLNAMIDKICKDATAMRQKYQEELAKVIGEDVVKSGDQKAIAKAIADAKAAGKTIPEQERIIVFIDEIDSVMMVDKSDSAKFSNDVLNEFKKGFTEKLGKQDNVITIGATNLEIDAKKAMSGDGKTLDKPMLDRFASKVRVPNPDAKQIEETIIRHYQDKELVSDELKKKNPKLTKLAQYMAKEDHNMSFRKLLSVFDKTANRTTGSGKKVTIEDIKKTLKEMKDEFHMNDSGIGSI